MSVFRSDVRPASCRALTISGMCMGLPAFLGTARMASFLNRPLTAVTWTSGASLVTVMDPETSGLMARKWPSHLPWQLNVARRPPVVNMVAYLAQPQSAMRRQVA